MEHPLAHERLLEKISRQELEKFLSRNNGVKCAKTDPDGFECWDFQDFYMHIMDTEKLSEDCFAFKVAFSGNVPPEFYENIKALNQQNGRKE